MGVGGWITDGVSAPLQEPKVSQTELDEYKKYVHQFDDLSKWIVPPSRQLYRGYINGQPGAESDVPPVEPSSAGAIGASKNNSSVSATTGRIRLNASDVSFFRDTEQLLRSRTPTPGPSRSATHMPLSATASIGQMGRLLGAQKTHSQERQQRLRSNTSSERSTLWGLWSHLGDSAVKPRHQSALAKNNSQKPVPFATNRQPADGLFAVSPAMRGHERSRSLDFAKGALPASDSSPPHSKAGPDTIVAEPRVSEADLRVYQEYVKMRKAMVSHNKL
ncbi:hypothetical protein GGI12_006362 [Dipsacomyces acuminosporus]|nr:hypothetical protein GGI12_006362 [Dipsacomyces acuminosporus]